ncbi:MAG: isocitrate/isopropylmalate dehydrogenase family protein [Euryarchaeota archaeon]|nr:isocitrate/isopropylmalate dehydrogenase family protein [Euryarchaeota archaeon]
MARPDIAWLPGDGIGREVLGAARLVLDATGFEARYMPGDIGWEFWRKEGTPLPDRTIELLRRTDCALFGAVTSKPEADAMAELSEAQRARGARYSGAVVRIRRMFDLFTNLRPCRAYPGNPGNMREGVDITIFRENTEGMYSGVEWDRIPQELYEIRGMERVPRQAAIAVRAITKRASHRIAKSAFEHAASVPRRSWPARAGIAGRDGERRRVTAVHKANVLRATDGVFLSAVREVARDHPEIEYEEMLVDACAMRLVGDPLHFDVLVTTNMFGDILSDLCAQLVGGLGFAPGANIGDDYAMFEPAHGSAPDIAGRGVANPVAAVLSARLMLGWLGEKERAGRVEAAVAQVIREGRVRTPDMGGSMGTMALATAIAAKVGRI